MGQPTRPPRRRSTATRLTILRQQIRDCADAISAAQKAVAVAIAQNEQEVEQHAKLVTRIDDLEGRVVAALEQEKQSLAREARGELSRIFKRSETPQRKRKGPSPSKSSG